MTYLIRNENIHRDFLLSFGRCHLIEAALPVRFGRKTDGCNGSYRSAELVHEDRLYRDVCAADGLVNNCESFINGSRVVEDFTLTAFELGAWNHQNKL
jgi:hypothetical protein